MRLGNRIYRPGVATVIISKIDTYGTPQNRTYRTWGWCRLFFLKLTLMVRFPNRIIGVNLGSFSTQMPSLRD